MNGLVEFLTAAIAEDEAVARKTPGDHAWECDPHPARPVIAQVVSSDGALASDVLTPDAHHIARWDPARALAECEGKRRIVELHGRAHECSVYQDGEVDTCHWCLDGDECSTLRLLAIPYADRPGFREEWRA